MTEPASALDLVPLEILLMIVPYLNAKDLLSFCATTRQLQYNPELRESASYWSHLTTSTFRVPNHPVVEHDGKRWMRLYRRMRTHTKVFGWGNEDRGCLGDPIEAPVRRRGRVGNRWRGTGTAWPRELNLGVEGGHVADLQCGGWSTVVLSTKGVLIMLGMLNGQTFNQMPHHAPKTLLYPPGFVPPSGRYDIFTAIRQFSTGRSHILGVSDSGRIWSWHDADRPAVHVKFLTIDIVESDGLSQLSKRGHVRSVFASWNRSTAYIEGTGIVVWTPSDESEQRGHSDQSEVDTMLVMEQWIVPRSGYLNSDRQIINAQNNADAIYERDKIGEVKSYTALVDFILFSTDLGKLFAVKIPAGDEDPSLLSTPFRVSSNGEDDEVGPDDFVADVQGAFESFAVLKRNGEVLISNNTYLSAIHARHFGLSRNIQVPTLRKVPALQSSGVIALSFGDWHFQALHSDGTISSHGRESETCGCLGLGELSIAMRRGMRLTGDLLPHCQTTGRRVQFEGEKRMWLERTKDYLDQTGNDARSTENLTTEVSEQIEARLRTWESGPAHEIEKEPVKDDSDDGLPAYFALSVASGGWHSGALVLVNEEKAEKVRELYKMKSSSTTSQGHDNEATDKENNTSEPTSIFTGMLNSAASLGRTFLGLPPAGSPRPSAARSDEGIRWVWDEEDVNENGETTIRPFAIDLEEGRTTRTVWKEVEEVDL